MATFIYSPQIRVRIACDGSKKADDKNINVIDISEDLVQGTLNLRTNGVHTFNFQLQNAMRKYDGLIQPMDRITIEMKRIAWVRVFSGYLNNGPVFSAFPRVIQLSASCTLKRLQFWFWDPTTTTSFNLLTQASGQTTGTAALQDDPTTPNVDESKAPAATAGANGAAGAPAVVAQPADQKFDDGIKGVVLKLLSEVVAWPADKVHIGEIPAKWITFAQDVGNKIIQDADQSKYIGNLALGAAATVGGSGTAVNGNIQPGVFGGRSIDAEQARNASILLGIAKGRGKNDNVLVSMMMCGLVESGMRNLDHGTGSSVGIFQLIASHGSVAQRMDPAFCANWWLNTADQLVGPAMDTMAPGVLAQRVERSAFPDRYAAQDAPARALVAAFNASVGAGAGVAAQNAGAVTANGGAGLGGAPLPGAAAPAAGAPAANSGRKFAQVAHGVIASKPPGYIRYQLGGDDPMTSPDPKVLDCSSFVDLVYYRTVGHGIRSGRTTAAIQQTWAAPRIPVDLALKVKGALIFGGNPAHHVEVSLGNGTTAAARTDENPIDKQVYVGPASRGDTAGLVPGLSYADAATDPAAAQQLSAIVGYPVTATDPNEFGAGAAANAGGAQGGGIDPFNALLNVYTWGFNVNVSGDNYQGPRAMMNDTPILPYIANLLSASMRSFCSAPNGDFIAWFPDYFGLFGSAAKMNIRTIELQDFTVEWNDQKIVTHQYVVGAPNGFLDQATGNVSGVSTNSSGASLNHVGQNDLAWKLLTSGIATMEYKEIFRTIFGRDASDEFLKNYLYRFGGRPDMKNMPALRQGLPEFFMALYLFMQNWAAQFKAVVPMTFMPELWPGMLLVLPEYNFQAYITEVQHTFRFGAGGGFQTQAQIIAPSRTTSKDDIFGLLPLGGKAYLEATQEADKEAAANARYVESKKPLSGPGGR